MALGEIDIPKPGEWPGTIQSFRIVRQYIKPRIWDFVSVIGIGIALLLVVDIIVSAIFRTRITGSIVDDVISFIVGAFMQATIIAMYFKVLKNEDFSLNSALLYGYRKMLKMTGLLLVMDVIIVASFVLLVIPFFFVLPRVYLAPYYFVFADCNVNQAIAASWHSTKGNSKKVYGILLLDIAFALLFLTIIGIPFAIYWGIINSGSFAFITLYLSQPKNKSKTNKSILKAKPA